MIRVKTTYLISICALDRFRQMLETRPDVEDARAVRHDLAVDAGLVRHATVALLGQGSARGSRDFGRRRSKRLRCRCWR